MRHDGHCHRKKDNPEREREVLNNVVDILKDHLNPGKIILFGSRAKGISSLSADFDLAVDRERVDIRMTRKIREEIDRVAGLYKVDIVFLNSVDNRFREIILKTGKVIYER